MLKTYLLLPFLIEPTLFSEATSISVKSFDCSTQIFNFLKRSLENEETFLIINEQERRSYPPTNPNGTSTFNCNTPWYAAMNQCRISTTQVVLLFGSFSWVKISLEYGYRKGFLRNRNKVISIIDNWGSESRIIKVSRFLPNLLFMVKNPSTCDLKLYNVPQNSNKMVVYGVVPYSNLESAKVALFPPKWLNFKDKALRVGYNIYRPYVYKDVNGDLIGIDIAIIKELAKYLKFQIKFVTPSDGKWGKLENATWNGLVKMVMDGDADIAISMIVITESRNTVVDYTEPYTVYCKSFISPLPVVVDPWNSLMKPFTWPVWVGLIASVLLSTIVFKAVKKFNETRNQIKRKDPELRNHTQFLIRCLLKQGVVFPESSYSKIYTLTWLLFSLILTSSYAGLLTGFLTAPLMSSPITTMDQLLNTSIPIGLLDYGGIEEEEFKSTVQTSQLWDKSFRPPSFKEAFKSVMGGDIILLHELSSLQTENFDMTKGKREDVVTFGKETLFVQPAAFIVQKYSNFGSGLTNGIIRLNNGGLIQKWIQSFSGTDFDYNWENSQSKNVILTLEHLRSGFYVLLGGLFFSALIFLVERNSCCK